ncbi:1-deoxy-D-xylulose-5-phosphate reductoisomerase [Streptococcus danieliae]|uniref:1-deoxy-D-xylulose 5-phosphate reductoisomerase n=1 Tax=Streptococcus danieliae TaxID=747656 RepID=A0A7Z0S5L2_9STRE|nr:1-deoxy-D-xylulose-5-phosphate reductoisomerase [Streptococcus danieliae]MBF0700163.1 1-deoxy-D-xylulose-5-phosphate reductoisomerase [Streptococcus danieliae]NYS97339.1 1-deoxy-D-xylulose-5-phosphate reductoisomerase [Streptococcus danieliae]
MKAIYLMGATGSIGQQTLDILRAYPDQFRLLAFSFAQNIDAARAIVEEFKPAAVVVADSDLGQALLADFPELEQYTDLEAYAAQGDYDLMVNAVMGSVGLKATLAAIQAQKEIALANKETLVMAGDFVMAAARDKGVSILPVDSEHSAIFQAMQGLERQDVKKLVITASGGSFRDKTRAELAEVTVAEALAHPNWTMGAKITIDSSTMVNKGLEVIEAHHLFDWDYDQIEVIQHRESLVHSMIEMQDGAFLAQLGPSDMREPIQFALTYPRHQPLQNSKPFDLTDIGQLHFEKLDLERFPVLALAFEVGRRGGSFPAVYNAANEVAVAAFLDGQIAYLEIESLIERAVADHVEATELNLERLLEIDRSTREKVRGWLAQ